MNFYNEIDPYCCDWLENLIREGLIPDGIVDRRSIVDILPAELKRFTQCHFFAGLGGWPLALRLAAYPDHRPVWTGSCPCQPFSAAGKRLGFADDRHLWPYWRYLIAVGRPPAILGEQVASAADWLRLVRGDLEALEYAVGCMPVEAASAGADHLRDRFWFVAHDEHEGEGRGRLLGPGESAGADAVRASGQPAGPGHNGVALGDANEPGSQGWSVLSERGDQRLAGQAGVEHAARLGRSEGRTEHELVERNDTAPAEPGFPFDMGNPVGAGAGRVGGSGFGAQAPGGGERQFDGHFRNTFESSGSAGHLGFADGTGWALRESSAAPARHRSAVESAGSYLGNGDLARAHANSSASSSRPATGEPSERIEWVLGADGKARRVKSGIRLLAHGVPSRVAKLRALGNAIDPRPAAAFIKAALTY